MVHFTPEQVGEVLQRLFDSEINATVVGNNPKGLEWELGDAINGKIEFQTMRTAHKSVAETVTLLAFHANIEYPESEFAKWYRNYESTNISPGEGNGEKRVSTERSEH